MDHRTLDRNAQDEISRLFTSVFASSEGEEEGRVVGHLAAKLALAIENRDVVCFGTYQEELLIASIFFTRLVFNDPIRIFMLSPVAVSTKFQRMGVGQALIRYGLHELETRSVDAVVTYGDPSFYSNVGFRAVSEDIVQAPFALSRPEGWLGQSLTEKPIPRIEERPRCVAEFNDPALW